jgi:hypothetical protein
MWLIVGIKVEVKIVSPTVKLRASSHWLVLTK